MNQDMKKSKILIIDDDVNMMEMLSIMLKKYDCDVSIYTEPVSAIEELKSNQYDVLLLNFLMSPVNGDRIVKLVREFDKEIYIILMSTHSDLAPSMELMQNLEIQAYFEKSSRFDELIMLIQGGIKYIEQVNKIKKYTLQLDNSLIDFAKILLNTIGAKDHYTEEHSKRVSILAEEFGKFIKLSDSDITKLKRSGLFHDIGKIGITDSILLKEGKLTDNEYEIIKSHPIIGANIFEASTLFKELAPIILSHHERIDGKGYPNNLKGDEIPFLAKILTLCDCFDAIVSKRPYKSENTVEFGIEQIKQGISTQFDKELSNKFIKFVKSNRSTIDEILKK